MVSEETSFQQYQTGVTKTLNTLLTSSLWNEIEDKTKAAKPTPEL